MLDRQRGQVRVRNEMGGERMTEHQAGEDRAMPFSGPGYPDTRAIQPLFHQRPYLGYRSGELNQARVRLDAHERQKALPREADRVAGAELRIEPRPGQIVGGGTRCRRVDQDIRVDEDQRRPSPSPIASAAATSSTSTR